MTNALARLTAALAERYRLERELGQGGMATVYLAHDVRHDREVAIKVLRSEVSLSLGGERFLREIRLAARLQHPHILPLFDSGEADGLLYYVMPYVPGESLRQRLVREKLLPVADAHRIAREVADALAFAHAAGVIHRDIKPENILLAGDHAVVADFGIARAINEAGGDSLTSAGLAVGTPAYMSPEQCAGERNLDGRSDIYSLGCVLYEMLTGSAPFQGPTTESIVQQHLAASAIPVEVRRLSVPVVTCTIVRRALAKEPADRFATATQMAEALAQATETSGGSPVSPQRGSRRSLVITGVTALVVVAGLFLVQWLRGPAASPAPVAEDAVSVAILRCQSPGSVPTDDFLSDGITQEIISRLAQVPNLNVISGSSVLPLARASLSTKQVADTLGVRYVLECTVAKARDRIRVFGQLVDARTSAVKWAKPFERATAEEATIEDEIAQQVVAALMAQGGTLRPTGVASRTRVPQAAEAVLQGNYLLHRRSPDAIRGAITAYTEAVKLDSGFAPAYGALGAAFGLSLTYNADLGRSPYVVYAQGLVLLTHAIELDSSLAEAYAARGYIATKAYGPSEPIAADFAQALRYRPNSADVHGWYAHFLSREGRHDQALAEAEKAIALDPIAPGRRVGFSLDALAANRVDLAAREAEHAIALEPDLGSARMLAAISGLLLGDAARCAAARPPRPVLVLCLHSAGKTKEARQIVDSLERASSPANVEGRGGGGGGGGGGMEQAIRARDLTSYYAWIKNSEQAAAWLQRAFAASPNAIDDRVLASRLFDGVRKEPAFVQIYERLRGEVWPRTQAVRDGMTLAAALRDGR